ncbi:glycoside hydrolase family 113 [Streptomyces pathocidini]|uniref:Glycoside hydrolase family 113 n=1 Tax=Streptomyces pathocidini TaxID=1650571 RepID=A0ABW7UZI8_9ACTN|nr:hypothetical protein [Streptomyces pathocidini]
MKRSRLPLLAVFPSMVLAVVVVVPLVFGDHLVRWKPGSLLPGLFLGGSEESPPSAAAAPKPDRSSSPPKKNNENREVTKKVSKVWQPGAPQWGVQIYWEDNQKWSVDFIAKQARKHADYLVDLGANSVSLSFPFYTGGISSTEITAGAMTPSPARTTRVLNVFREAGLRTTLRPIMDEQALNPPKGWRGNIEPADRAAWFTSYQDFLSPYLEIAEEVGVATFAIGTELNSMEGDPGWDALVTSAEGLYSGEIEYDANWDNYVAGHIDVPVRHLGVDAYFPIKVSDGASVDRLVEGWHTWLNKKSQGDLPGVLLSEAGIGARDGAYHAPGDAYAKGPVNPDVQANWYTAVCRVVQERQMAGVYWWSVSFEDDPRVAPNDTVDSRLNFAGRPKTEAAVKECFNSEYEGPGEAAEQ